MQSEGSKLLGFFIHQSFRLGWFDLVGAAHPGCFIRSKVYTELGGYRHKFRLAADFDFDKVFYLERFGVLDKVGVNMWLEAPALLAFG